MVRAPEPPGAFPTFGVYDAIVRARGGTPIPASNARYWTKPTYPDRGGTYSSLSALNAAIAAAGSGSNDVFRLTGGPHSGAITIPRGVNDITVCAHTRGGVTVEGTVTVAGNRCNVMGFVGSKIQIDGDDNLVAYMTNDGNTSGHVARSDGDRNRVCYCTFSDTSGAAAQMFNASDPDPSVSHSHNRCDHNHFIRHLGGNPGGSELAQFGQNAAGTSWWSLFDDNYCYYHQNDGGVFVDNSEGESITNKSDNNLFIHNVFVGCMGRLNDRTGRRSTWYANFVDGEGYDKTAGIKFGTDALCACNIIKNVGAGASPNRGGIQWSGGTLIDGASDNPRADDAEATFNTVVNCTSAVQLGTGGGQPVDPRMFGNAVSRFGGGDTINAIDYSGTLTAVANVIEAPVGLADAGIRAADPQWTIENQIPRPTEGGNLDGTGPALVDGYSRLVTVDFLGNPIPPTGANVGAIQPGYDLSTDPVQAIIAGAGADA
jgi:hypothetical protein